MNDVRWSKLTGVVLMLTPVAFNVFFALLSVTFGYPDILREPTGEVLRRFDAGGGSLVAIWYGFMLTAVLFVGLAILVHKVLARRDAPYMADVFPVVDLARPDGRVHLAPQVALEVGSLGAHGGGSGHPG